MENADNKYNPSDSLHVSDSCGGGTVQDTTLKDYFRIYLSQDGYSDRGAMSLIDILSRYVDNYIRMVVYPHHTTVFDILDMSRLIEYKDSLRHNPDFISFNTLKGRRPYTALQKYIDFVRSFGEGDVSMDKSTLMNRIQEDNEAKKDDQQKLLRINNDSEKAVMEITQELKELGNVEGVLKRNGLPVNPEIQKRVKELKGKKLSIIKGDLIEKPILDLLRKHGLLKVITFKYVHPSHSFELLDPVFNEGIDEEVADLETIISLMNKNGIPVPADVHNRLRATKNQKIILERAKGFSDWLKAYMSDLYLADLALDSIYYSPRTLVMTKFVDPNPGRSC